MEITTYGVGHVTFPVLIKHGSLSASTRIMATDHHSASTSSAGQRPTGDEILQNLRNRTDSHYLGNQDLDKKSEYFIGGVTGNQLVLIADDDNPIEFLVTGVFEIDRRDFYFTADANFDPSNKFNGQFSKSKATCRLLPVKRHPMYDFAKKHFPMYISSIAALERKAPAPQTATIQSSIVNTDEGSQAIKLTHALFQVQSFRHPKFSHP